MLDHFRDSSLVNLVRSALPPSLRWKVRDTASQVSSFLETGRVGLFSTVAIETTTRCNRRCDYCPYSDPGKYKGRGETEIDDKLFTKIIDDLASLHFKGKLALQGYGEPLLDTKLEERIRQARGKLSHAYITINSNGDHLKLDVLRKLIAAGLSHVYVTNHSKKEQVPADIQAILDDPAFKGKISYYHGLSKLQNRGGSVDIGKFHGENRVATSQDRDRCISSVNTLNINVDGSVVVCDNHFDKVDAVGNIEDYDTLEELWRSDRFMQIRKNLRRGILECGACKACNIGAGTK